MPPAIIGGAIAAAGTIGGAVLANKGASKAANATRDAADQAAAVQREARTQNTANLTPFMQTGMGAMGNINALLGIAPQAVPGGGASSGGMVGGADWNAYLQQNPDVARDAYRDKLGRTPEQFAEYHWNVFGNQEGRQSPYAATTGAVGTTGAAQPTAEQAFDTFRNSTGYQFRFNQGLDAVNGGYAGAGTIKSGAAMKAINDYGQGMASQEFGNYLNALGNQQQMGFSGASALAGVSQNSANNLGQIAMNTGDNLANAALLRSQNNGQAINSLATIGSGILGRQGGGGFNPNTSQWAQGTGTAMNLNGFA